MKFNIIAYQHIYLKGPNFEIWKSQSLQILKICGEGTDPFRPQIRLSKAKHAWANVVFGTAGRSSVINGTGIRFLRRIWPTSFICNSNFKERSFS